MGSIRKRFARFGRLLLIFSETFDKLSLNSGKFCEALENPLLDVSRAFLPCIVLQRRIRTSGRSSKVFGFYCRVDTNPIIRRAPDAIDPNSAFLQVVQQYRVFFSEGAIQYAELYIGKQLGSHVEPQRMEDIIFTRGLADEVAVANFTDGFESGLADPHDGIQCCGAISEGLPGSF